ncbi:MAG: hypothetical protein PWR10_1781 [Halanaerobiales bacterium]|nr:hypothetical protein [Halanaerobiales bacterium]
MLIKNKLNSPLSIDLGNGNSIHLQPLERRDVNDKDLKADQIKAAIRAGYIKVLPDKAPAKKKRGEK